jgi:hypothetical protein
MKLLLITGAGASRNLSADPSMPMPLMADWAETLRADLGPDLARMATLTGAASGADFEETLGALFRWYDQLDQAKRFAGMARTNYTDAKSQTSFERGISNARKHFQLVLKSLHQSLFQEFGPNRIDGEQARQAYEQLFAVIGDSAGDSPQIICATTNYDRSLEAGLEAMGRSVRMGFKPHSYRTPTLDPTGLGVFQRNTINVLYLHGAVGWYKRGSRITSLAADAPFNASLGDPAVLYPGPDKDVGRTETVELWHEFQAAVGEATHIFVLGHALNDAHLVDALKGAGGKVAVSVYPVDSNGEPILPDEIGDLPQTAFVCARLPEAHAIGVDFGPVCAIDEPALTNWQEGSAPMRKVESKAA